MERVERYGLSWAGKSAAMREAHAASTAALFPMPDQSLEWDTSENRIIEGDNLETLRLLQNELCDRVKMIYIDPPYNTGGDFTYPDNFRTGVAEYVRRSGPAGRNGAPRGEAAADGRYHSAWLSMMYPRLLLARKLLSGHGLLFVSIDDHEVHNLRLLLNELFGEENFVQQLIWKRHAGGGNDARHFATDHEYILVYARSRHDLGRLRVPLTDQERREYRARDEWPERGPFKTKSFRRMRDDDPRPGLQYAIEAPDGTRLFDEWKWERSRFLAGLEEGRVLLRKDRAGRWHVEYKLYLNEADSETERTRVPRSLLFDVERNSAGKKQLREVLGEENVFSNPKPVGLIKYLLRMGTTPDSIVLDFFAGSGTTAQAVHELNQEDGGARRFILVQLPEPTGHPRYPTIADITKERVRRVMCAGGTQPNAGFRVYKLRPHGEQVG